MKGLNLKAKIKLIAVTALLTLAMSVTALASAVIDTDKKGSITVRVKAGEEVLRDGAVTVYRVGRVNNDKDGYELTGDFIGSGIPLTDIQDTSLALKFESYVNENGIEGMATVPVNEEGKAEFSDLEIGLYLFIQTGVSKGYEPFTPFLVSVPYLFEDDYIYNVTADEKTALERITETEPEPAKPTSSTNSGGGGNGRTNTDNTGPGAEILDEDEARAEVSSDPVSTDSLGGIPQTGEGNGAVYLFGACIISAVLLTVLLYIRRRIPGDQKK